MRTTAAMALVVSLVAPQASASTWSGTIKLGGIFVDEEGDLSAVQETYNIHDGFSVGQIRFSRTGDQGDRLALDLREINLDGRQANLHYRIPGRLQLRGSFDQHRQVFDPQRAVTSDRKDWRVNADYNPNQWLRLSGYFNGLSRDGDRLSFPLGTESGLGTAYDSELLSGRLAAEVHKGSRGFAVDYRGSSYTDALNADADRTGRVISARVFGPALFYEKWTHLLRGAYGVSELSNRDLDYTLSRFQYTGVVRPITQLQLKYNFDAQRVDSQSTELQTDRIQNNFEASAFHRHGSVFGGYGYETNDDDRSLTSYHTWRVGGSLRHGNHASARVSYAGRVRNDDEDLTLLKDSEASRLKADIQVRPIERLSLSANANVREREYPDINVEAEGFTVGGNARYTYPSWGGLFGNYTYSNDEYQDLVAGFAASSHVVTGNVDFDRIPDLLLSAGLTYLDIGEDLDIEKLLVTLSGIYDLREDLHLEVKYNAYNYDDFVLTDRYYTANVVWVHIAYDLGSN